MLMAEREKPFVPSPKTFPFFSFTLYSDTKMETRNVNKWSVLSSVKMFVKKVCDEVASN